MPRDSCSRRSHRTVQFRYQKAANGMGFRSGFVVVMLAKRLIDFVQGFCPLQLGGAFPNQSEPLATNTTIHFSAFVADLAKYLHCRPHSADRKSTRLNSSHL